MTVRRHSSASWRTPRRRRLRRMAGQAPLAGGIRLPGLRLGARLESGDQGVDVGVRRLRPPDVGDCGHDHSPYPPAAAHLVPGRPPRRHPLQRHFGLAASGEAWHRLVQGRLAAVAQAAEKHGRPGARPVGGDGRDRREHHRLPHQGRSRGRGHGPQPRRGKSSSPERWSVSRAARPDASASR